MQGATSAVVHGPVIYLIGAATVLVFGINWPIMAAGDRSMPALWLAAFRLVGAAAILFAVAAARHRLSALNRQDVPILLSVGLVRIGLVNALVFTALRFVPPGHASVFAYTTSLWTLPIAAIWLGERLTPWRIGGVAVGCVGLALLLEPWALDWSETRTLLGISMLLAGAVAMAITTVHIRAHRWQASPLDLMAWQLVLGAVPTVAVASAIEGSPRVVWSAAAIAIIAFEVVFASCFAMWGELTFCRSLPSITANLFFMAVPAVGLGASVLWAGEVVTLAAGVGFVLILLGVAAGLMSDRRLAGEDLMR